MVDFKTKRLTFLLLLILSFANRLKGIEVGGEILNFNELEISINTLFGRFPMKSDELKIPLTKTGEFIVDIEIGEIRYAEMIIGENKIQLFLSPKTTKISIHVDYSDFKNTLTFQGGCSIENSFLNKRSYLNYHQKFNDLNKEDQQNAKKIDAYFESEETKELGQLLKIKNKISEEHYKILSEEIRNYYLILKIKGGLEIGYKDLAAYEKKWMNRNDELVKQITCEPSNKYSPYFNHLLGTYYSHLERKLQITLMKDSVHWIAQFGLESVKDIISEVERDYYNKPFYVLTKDEMCEGILEKALSNKIYRSQEDNDYENLVYIYEEFEKRFPRSEFLERLESRMEIYKKFEEFKSAKDNEREGINFYPKKALEKGILSILNEEGYQGKVLLLDMWGTWCGPCREQFPYMNKLKKQLSKEEDIAFLYFSMEVSKNPEEHWMETVKYFNLKGDHYLATKEIMRQFKGGLNEFIPGEYPMYIIVNKKGEIAKVPAAYPSDGDKLFEQIKNVLMEK